MVRPNKKKLSRKRTTYKSKKPHKKHNTRLKQPKKTKTHKTKRKTRQSKRKSRKLKGGNGPRGTEVVKNPVSEDMTQNTKINTELYNSIKRKTLPFLQQYTDENDKTNFIICFEYNNETCFIEFNYDEDIFIYYIEYFNDTDKKYYNLFDDEFDYKGNELDGGLTKLIETPEIQLEQEDIKFLTDFIKKKN